MFVSALVSAMAVATLGGCAGSEGNRVTTMNGYSSPNQGTTPEKASLSTATLTEDEIRGFESTEQFIADAQAVQLPQRHLSEAWTSNAEAQARRAAAASNLLGAQADNARRIAEADARQQASRSQNRIAQSGAERLEEVYAAKLGEAEMAAVTREIEAAIKAERQDKMLEASVKEWQSEVDKLRAAAEAEWMQARAEHERMLAERIAVDDRGRAQIAQMVTAADRTEERASAKVRALRAEAETVTNQTQARVSELQQRIRTVEDNTAATVSELRQRAASARQDGLANAEDLRARATAIEEQDVDETFRLSLSAAEASFEENKAEVERLYQAADALQEELEAEYTRRFSEANTKLQIDRTDYEEALKGVSSFVEHGKGEVARLRVEADRVEREGRANFVRAEAEAAAEAIRESSRHQFELAEEQYAKLHAEAEAEAARVKSEYLTTLAQQREAGQVTVPGKTEPKEPAARSGDGEPGIDRAPQAAERLDPDHIAAFKSALARAASLRVQADASERDLFATAEERRAGFENWWQRRNAAHEAAIADAETYKGQTRAKINQFVAEADSLMSQATAQLGNSKMNAEASRRESLASMTTLLADADAIEKKAIARETQLLAKADATERNGASEARALRVSLDAERRRGSAKAQRLIAEADSLEESQRAIVAQMRSEIDSARRILSSELAKLDQAAESFIEVAEATFRERESEVAMLAKLNEATREEMIAANDAQRQIDLADAGRMKRVNQANQLVAQAAVERALADADAEFGFASAADTLARVSARTDLAIAKATTSEQFIVADAEDRATRALFDSRIVSTLAERDKAYADVWLEGQRERVRREQAVALAAAYQELSSQAVNRLNEQTATFNEVAQDNWHSQLAMPSPLPQPIDTDDLNRQAEQLFDLEPIIVTVPTIDE